MLIVKKAWNWNQCPGEFGRGKVQGFSKASRLRMLKRIAVLDWDRGAPWVLISLTYPDDRADRSYRERTRDRYLFHRYMEKYLGKKVGMMWRVEVKPRLTGQHKGKYVTHMHMVVAGVQFIPWQLVRKWWRTILDVEGPLCTDIRRAGGETAAWYAAKYAAKKQVVCSLDNAAYLNNLLGRAWGLTRASALPWCPTETWHGVPELTAKELRKIASHLMRDYNPEFGGSFTVFGDVAKRVGRALMEKKACQSDPGTLQW